jgi:hypothetical protein
MPSSACDTSFARHSLRPWRSPCPVTGCGGGLSTEAGAAGPQHPVPSPLVLPAACPVFYSPQALKRLPAPSGRHTLGARNYSVYGCPSRRFAEAVYRAAIADGIMEGISYEDPAGRGGH